MKFEAITSSKFKAFEPHKVENLNAVTGGVTDTQKNGTQHDTAQTGRTGTTLDGVSGWTNNGQPSSSDTNP